MRIIAVLLTLIVSSAGAAQINKCMDKSGKVVGYANECPAGTRSEAADIKAPPAPAPAVTPAGAAPPSPKSLAERDADFRKRQIEKQEAEAKADKKSAEAEQR